MKRFLIFLPFLFFSSSSFAYTSDSLTHFQLPDSIKAVSFLADISVTAVKTKKEAFIGIRTDLVKLSLESDKKENEIVFEFPPDAEVVSTGIGIKAGEKGELSWKYNWELNANYKLLIVTAGDSVGNFALYSAYIFLPRENKWKLIGTCKIHNQWNTLKQPAVFFSRLKKDPLQIAMNEAWCQRANGSWKNLLQKDIPLPTVNLLSHLDSLQQFQSEKAEIEKSIEEKRTDVSNHSGGIYYTILKEGSGRQVSVNDTVIVNYKGYLFNNGSVFDETKDKPATFPLKRLIMGWQLAVPLCKVGGKIKFIIPSALAYSIRTRSAKIPPNSILVFEVEVLDARSPL